MLMSSGAANYNSNCILILSPVHNEANEKNPISLPFSSLTINNKYYHCKVDFINHSMPSPPANLDESLCGLLLFIPFPCSSNTSCLELIKTMLDSYIQNDEFQSHSKICIIVGDFSSDHLEGQGSNGLEVQMAIRSEMSDQWDDLCVIDHQDPLESWVDQVKQALECFQGWVYRETRVRDNLKESLRLGFSEKLLADGIRCDDIEDNQRENFDTLCNTDQEQKGKDEHDVMIDQLDATFQIISQIKDAMRNESNVTDDDNAWKRRVEIADRFAKSLGIFDDDE